MKSIFFLLIIITIGNVIYSQETSCKVLKKEISGSYSGECKNGYAHGQGIAKGIDQYDGRFKKGLPDGKGIYTWANGFYYDGEWKDGLKEGKGRMVYKDSTSSGYWKYDKYVGEKLIPAYMITRSLSITRSTFTKVSGVNNNVTIKLARGGNENADISNFTIALSSGNEYHIGPTLGIQNAIFPLDVIIKFRALNPIHTSEYDAQFEFTINEPASWNVMISY